MWYPMRKWDASIVAWESHGMNLRCTLCSVSVQYFGTSLSVI